MRPLLLLFVLFLVMSSCSSDESTEGDSTDSVEFSDDPMDKFGNAALRAVVQLGIDAAGGLETYLSLEHIAYKKHSKLYLEDGSIESDVTRYYEYQLTPELRGTITWIGSEPARKIVYEKGDAYMLEDGTRIEGSESSARQAFLSEYYALLMPFKLIDDGADVSYEGQSALANGMPVDVVKVTYDPDKQDHYDTTETWWYYFLVGSGEYLAAKVYHEPTNALIENIEMNMSTPIVFNSYRRSWRVDSLGKKQFLRGEFAYSEFQVN